MINKKFIIKKCYCGKKFKTYPSKIKLGKGKYCSKECYYFSSIGKKFSEEHKRKISEKLKGRKNEWAIGNKFRRTHNLTGTKIYYTWENIKNRCNNTNRKDNYLYRNRGITVCNRWLKFINFKNDMYESYLEHIKSFGEKNTTIDRINNNGNYEPNNCKWATNKEQSNNRRNIKLYKFNNQKNTLTEWSNITGIKLATLWARIYLHKWSIEKTLTTPKQKNQYK